MQPVIRFWDSTISPVITLHEFFFEDLIILIWSCLFLRLGDIIGDSLLLSSQTFSNRNLVTIWAGQGGQTNVPCWDGKLVYWPSLSSYSWACKLLSICSTNLFFSQITDTLMLFTRIQIQIIWLQALPSVQRVLMPCFAW